MKIILIILFTIPFLPVIISYIVYKSGKNMTSEEVKKFMDDEFDQK